MKKLKKLTKQQLFKAVEQSSKMEGLDFSRAKKNRVIIKKLKVYGRAFSV